MTGTEELRSEKSQSQGAHERFFSIFIREGQVCVEESENIRLIRLVSLIRVSLC
jgi:hypothetical protein